jgi:N-acetyl-anhydromuramyl-L-alanine amidase AmpD
MSGGQTNITRVVIHDEEMPERPTTAEDCAAYFASSSSGGSAHYITDNDSEQHCVPDRRVAWHAPPNSGSIGIEQSGYARQSRAEWLDDYSRRNIARTAARTAELCVRYGIPVRRLSVADLTAGARGICGHVDVSRAWGQSDHGDPGPNFPWDVFMSLVREGVNRLDGEAAVRAFQQQRGLTVDGDPGLQTVLSLGQPGPVTWRAVQRHVGVAQDGQPGPVTWTAIQRALNAHKF